MQLDPIWKFQTENGIKSSSREKIEIGDTYFYRDIIHPKYVVERSILADKDEIVGSGRLTFINDFIRNLYHFSGLKIN